MQPAGTFLVIQLSNSRPGAGHNVISTSFLRGNHCNMKNYKL